MTVTVKNERLSDLNKHLGYRISNYGWDDKLWDTRRWQVPEYQSSNRWGPFCFSSLSIRALCHKVSLPRVSFLYLNSLSQTGKWTEALMERRTLGDTICWPMLWRRIVSLINRWFLTYDSCVFRTLSFYIGSGITFLSFAILWKASFPDFQSHSQRF